MRQLQQKTQLYSSLAISLKCLHSRNISPRLCFDVCSTVLLYLSLWVVMTLYLNSQVVGPFYGHWSSYCTTKSYVWCEKWDTRDAPDRMTRRAMEQENRKLCDAKRRERNEEVRVSCRLSSIFPSHSTVQW